MGFDIFSSIVLDIQVLVSFDTILEWCHNEELGMGRNLLFISQF